MGEIVDLVEGGPPFARNERAVVVVRDVPDQELELSFLDRANERFVGPGKWIGEPYFHRAKRTTLPDGRVGFSVGSEVTGLLRLNAAFLIASRNGLSGEVVSRVPTYQLASAPAAAILVDAPGAPSPARPARTVSTDPSSVPDAPPAQTPVAAIETPEQPQPQELPPAETPLDAAAPPPSAPSLPALEPTIPIDHVEAMRLFASLPPTPPVLPPTPTLPVAEQPLEPPPLPPPAVVNLDGAGPPAGETPNPSSDAPASTEPPAAPRKPPLKKGGLRLALGLALLLALVVAAAVYLDRQAQDDATYYAASACQYRSVSCSVPSCYAEYTRRFPNGRHAREVRDALVTAEAACRASRAPPPPVNYYYIAGLGADDNWLALRTEPRRDRVNYDTEFSRTNMRNGTLLVYLGQQGEFYNVRLLTGQTGWATSRFILCCRTR